MGSGSDPGDWAESSVRVVMSLPVCSLLASVQADRGSHRNSATGSVHVSDQTFKLTNLQGNQNRSQSLNTGRSVRSKVRSAVSRWKHSFPVSCSALQLRLSVSEEYLEHLQAENTGNCLSMKLLQVSQETSDCS